MTLTPAQRVNAALNAAYEALGGIPTTDLDAAGLAHIEGELVRLALAVDDLCRATATN